MNKKNYPEAKLYPRDNMDWDIEISREDDKDAGGKIVVDGIGWSDFPEYFRNDMPCAICGKPVTFDHTKKSKGALCVADVCSNSLLIRNLCAECGLKMREAIKTFRANSKAKPKEENDAVA